MSLSVPNSLEYKDSTFTILDQTKLPLEVVYEKLESLEDVYNSIKTLKVRGAPAIGVAGAYGVVIAAKKLQHLP